MKKFWKFEIFSFVCFILHCVAAVMDNYRITSFIMIWTPVAAGVVCTVIAMWSLDKTGFEKKVFLIIAQLFGYLVLEVIFLIILFFATGGITL